MSDKAARPIERSDEERKFVLDLVERGEAAKPDAEGRLPTGATHEIIEDDAGDGAPLIRRRRFSLA